MKSISFICLIFAVFILMGCATLSEPKDEEDNLFVGIIIHTGEGHENYGRANVNGTHMFGIELTLKNKNSNKKYIIRTKKNGLFYSNILPEGIYEIERIYIKVTKENAWAATWVNFSNKPVFNIEKGKVNNFGVINWDSNPSEDPNFKYFQLHDNVIEEFKLQFPESDWLKKEFMNVNIEET